MLTQPYLNLYVNWLHTISRVSPAVDLLVVSEDRESCRWLRKSGLQPGASHVLRRRPFRHRTLDLPEVAPAGNTTITVECASNSTLPANSSASGSPGFAMLMRRRAGHIRRAVRGRCCVVWSDLDVLWLRDPMPYLRDAPESCAVLATQQPCTGGRSGRCLTAAFSAFFYDEAGSVAALMRRWVSLMPRAGRAGKRPPPRVRSATFDDAVRAERREAGTPPRTVCSLPTVHFPDRRHTKWHDELQAFPDGADSPFIVHADFARLPQKVAHLRSAGLWKSGSRREVPRGASDQR